MSKEKKEGGTNRKREEQIGEREEGGRRERREGRE